MVTYSALVTLLLSSIIASANATDIAGAYFTIPASSFLNVHTGSTFNISWSGAVPLATIQVEALNVSYSETLAHNVPTPSGFYLWSIPTNLSTIIGTSPVNFLIVDGQTTLTPNQYSAWFYITPPGTAATSQAALPSLATPGASYSFSTAPGAGDASAGLSKGAKAGIGIAAAVLVLGLVGAGFFFVRRARRGGKREGKKEGVVPVSEGGRNVLDKAELDAGGAGKGLLLTREEGGEGKGPLSEEERGVLEALKARDLQAVAEVEASEVRGRREEVVEKGADGGNERVELEAGKKIGEGQRHEMS